MVSVAATVVLVVGSSTLLGGILDGSGARLSLVVTTRGSRGGKDMTTGSDLGVGSGSSCPFPGLPGCGGSILVVVAVAVTLAPSAASGFELEFAAAAFSLLLAIAVAAKPEGWSKDLGGSGFILDNADRKALKRQRGEKKRGRGQEHVTVKKRTISDEALTWINLEAAEAILGVSDKPGSLNSQSYKLFDLSMSMLSQMSN